MCTSYDWSALTLLGLSLFRSEKLHLRNNAYYFMYLIQVRTHMASLGIRKFQDLVGRTDFLKIAHGNHEKAKTLNFANILRSALELRPGVNIRGGSVKQDFQLENRLDNKLLEEAAPVLEGLKKSVHIEMSINNESRAFASTLSYYISK